MKDYDNFQILENTHFDVDDIDDVLEHCTTHRLSRRKNILYSEDVLAFDIETSSFTMSDDSSVFDDTAVYYHIKGLTLKIDEHIESDIPDLKLYKQKFFGLIFLSRESGYPVDSLYKELNELYPYYFPDDIYHVSDQLLKIFEILALVKPKAEGDADKVSLMYVWQLAINGRVVIGRTWSDFIYVINKIEAFYRTHKDRRVIIYVHNLSFEMQHIFKLFAWSKVFAIAPRKPIYAITETGIEFRCSYLLSNYSLAVVGENLQKYKVKKLTGQLDYRQIRTPNTMLTDDELNYCINDVLVVSAYIKECIEADGSITKIPYTATGYCRNYCRFNCLSGKGRKNQLEQFKKYHKLMMGLTVDADEFEQLQRAFMGGFTHCSARYSMKTMHNCDSFDFTSSYPAVLLSEGLPMSKAQEVTISSREDLDMYINLYCCLFDVKFTGLAPKTINENYIPLSKCWSRSNVISNNGRVVSADEIYITITDVDFRIIEQNYVWKDMKVGKFRIYKRGYLPKELILSILSLYKDKTELKGVMGKETEYLKSKGLLNSVY